MSPFKNSMEPDNEPEDSGVSPGDSTPAPLPRPMDGRNNPSGLQSYPLPKDPNAPHGSDGDNDMNTAQEYGVDETSDVGSSNSVHQYGLK